MQQSQNKKAHLYSNKNFLEYALRSKSNSRAHLHTIKKYRVCAKKMCEKSLRNFKNSLHSFEKNQKKKKIQKRKKIVAKIK